MSEKEKNTDQEIETVTNMPRRNVVKTTVIGGAAITGAAVSGKWTKPVVDSVILPAHATTSDVAADDGEAPPAPRNFFGVVNNMVVSTKTRNDTQIAASEDKTDLLQVLAKQAIDSIIPSAHAQSSEAASLCVAEDQGAVDVVLQLQNPFTQLGPSNGTVNFTGTGALDSAIMLQTTCVPPFQGEGGGFFGDYTITLTDSMDGNLVYSIEVSGLRIKGGSGMLSGSIPEGACGQGAEMCPVFEELETDIQDQ